MPPIAKFKRLDVRPIIRSGADPCSRIFSRLDRLKPDEGIIIVAPFLPSPLVERLSSQGFASRVERGNGADWLVYFWRDAR